MKQKPFQAKFRRNPEQWRALINELRRIEAQDGIHKIMALLEQSTQERKAETRSSDNWSISLDATPIKSEAELIAACDVDLTKWQIDEFSTSTWSQSSKKDGLIQLYSVRAKFKKIKDFGLERLIDRIEKGLYGYQSPEFREVKADSKFCSIINLYDSHLDKVTRRTETDQESDIETNCELFNDAFDYLLSNVSSGNEVILPIGNDLFNVNNANNTTKKGTPQDAVLHHVDAFEIILDLIRDTIEKALEVGPVYIPMIPGNHDEDAIHLLGVVLSSIYKRTKHITIDHRRVWRKYKQFGENMFMFAHGNYMKSKISQIPHIMAQENKTMWANTTYRYAFLGDIHHKNEYQFLRGKDFIGVFIRFLRSISNSDVWHHKKGYIGVEKTAELYNISECGHFFNEFKYSF